MPVVAVINRKGGSGKSTLATHIAAQCAARGLRVMLGDVDRQQSAMAWLRRRAAQPLAQRAPIVGWTLDPRSVMRPPAGITHVVLDTPGGLRGLDLARVVMNADAILMPVGASAFDRESALDCHAELATLPRVAGGRCRVAMVGMRLDTRTLAGAALEAWAVQHRLPYIGALRETQAYVRSVEQGLTLFDLPAAKAQADLAQWQPIVDWLDAVWQAPQRGDQAGEPAGAVRRPIDVRPTDLRPMNVPVHARPAAPGTPASTTQRMPVAQALAPAVPTREAIGAAVPRRGFAERIARLFTALRSSATST